MKKACTKCGEIKDSGGFYRLKAGGYSPICRICHRKRIRTAYANKPKEAYPDWPKMPEILKPEYWRQSK